MLHVVDQVFEAVLAALLLDKPVLVFPAHHLDSLHALRLPRLVPVGFLVRAVHRVVFAVLVVIDDVLLYQPVEPLAKVAFPFRVREPRSLCAREGIRELLFYSLISFDSSRITPLPDCTLVNEAWWMA